jgi:hypothetical protein
MSTSVVLKKLAEVNSGLAVIMSDEELDWLADNDKHPNDVVSIRNPNQVGTRDTYVVAKSSHPLMLVESQKRKTLTSATRHSIYETSKVWDEPVDATTARGWYWPKQSTTPGSTLCAGHYLDYGPDHRRFDDRQETEPGTIHCVVIAKVTGRCMASKYVRTPEEARAFIETEAEVFGHPRK